MRVRMLTTSATAAGTLRPGDVADLPADVARRLIARRFAEAFVGPVETESAPEETAGGESETESQSEGTGSGEIETAEGDAAAENAEAPKLARNRSHKAKGKS